MDVIYNWLLHNIGNEGNFLTILTIQPHRNEVIEEILIMSRTKQFQTVDLAVNTKSMADKTEQLNQGILNTFLCQSADQVISYLSTGQKPVAVDPQSESALYLHELNPLNDTGSMTFPPHQ